MYVRTPITGEYVKCNHCGGRYHDSPCATVSEFTYQKMTAERRSAWKCHICRGEKSRGKSPNVELVHGDNSHHQQNRPGNEDETQGNECRCEGC